MEGISPPASEIANVLTSRCSPSGLHYRTVVSAGDPTTVIVLSTRVVAATTLAAATANCPATRRLEHGGVHRGSLFICSPFASVDGRTMPARMAGVGDDGNLAYVALSLGDRL